MNPTNGSLSFDTYGVPITASSKTLIEILDQATNELVSWSGNPFATIDKALEIDPNFIMGNIFRGVVDILSSIPNSSAVKKTLDRCKSFSTNLWREKKHMEAFQLLTVDKMRFAADIWEEILIEHPTDLIAIKFAHDAYFYLGESFNIRDSIGRVIKHWKTEYGNLPIYGNILGMHAFGLEETNLYKAAEVAGKKGYEINPTDSWSVHAVTHVYEMEGRQREGIEWLGSSRQHWKDSFLACHNSWHKALYHLELEEHEETLHIYDSWIRNTKSDAAFDLVDCSSLLFRCELANVEVGDRWEEVLECWGNYMEARFLTFNDMHIMMNIVGSKKKDLGEKLLASMEQYAVNNKDPNKNQATVTSNVGLALGKAIHSWGSQKYEDVVKQMMPIRYHIQSIGGSHAQRDIFNQLLIQASVKGNNYKLASALLSERLEIKPKQPRAWKTYADVLTHLNKVDAAKQAFQQYKTLLV